MAPAKKLSLGRVLVTGGCGMLGSKIIHVLLRDWECTGFVLDLRCEKNRQPESSGIRYIEGDITDTAKVVSIFEEIRPDVVIHTASPLAQGPKRDPDALFYKVNVDGTQSIVDACKQTGVKALVYTSSASVISNAVDDIINADERFPVIRGEKQPEYYTETKAHAEEIVLAANEPGKLLTCSLRPSGIFGEGDMMITFHMFMLYRRKQNIYQVGDNNNLFDFTYSENVAHAHLLAARALLETAASKTRPLDTEKVDGEAFFITNGGPVYFWDFSRALWGNIGPPPTLAETWTIGHGLGMFIGTCCEWVYWAIGRSPTFNRQRAIYSSMTRYFDITKARQRLGYEPLVTLDEGLKRGVKWALEQEKLGLMKLHS